MWIIEERTGCWYSTPQDKRLAIVGSRTIDDIDTVFEELGKISGVIEVISGGAEGVDSMAEAYAYSLGLRPIVIKPEWEKFGKKAGMLRNTEIVAQCSHLVAFWDGESRVTMDSWEKACKVLRWRRLVRMIRRT